MKNLIFLLVFVCNPLFNLMEAQEQSIQEKIVLTQKDYDESLAIFEQGKKDHNNSYQFSLLHTSFTGFYSKTTFVIKEGIVIKRIFERGDAHKGTKKLEWKEEGEEVGTHKEGKTAMTMDDIYKIGKGYIGKKSLQIDTMPPLDKENGTPHVFKINNYASLNTINGLISLLGYRHAECMDDCFNGYRIGDFEWKKAKKVKRKKRGCKRKK